VRASDQSEDRLSWISGDFIAGVLDSEADVNAALADLEAAGIQKKAIRVFSGQQGSLEIGQIGGEGLGGILLRAAANYPGNAKELIDHHREEAASGHHVVIIEVADQASAQQACDVLHAHAGRDILGRIRGSFMTFLL
jgi:hypothetical protein